MQKYTAITSPLIQRNLLWINELPLKFIFSAESDAVSALEAQAEQLAPLLSTSARLAIEMRLAQLLAKKGDLAKVRG